MGHTADMELTAEEIRVLGCLIEKERATPDHYPLTTNALRTACNQKSNRDPVVDYGVATVEQTMLSLRDHGFARTVTGSGRTVKHKQVVDEALALSNAEVSIIGVLLLRGPQTPNELRVRTERLHDFEGNDAVESTLDALTHREIPLVTCLGKAPGQREARWHHLLGETAPAETAPAPTAPETSAPETSAPATPPTVSSDRIADLEAEVEELRRELEELRTRFDDLAGQLGVV